MKPQQAAERAIGWRNDDSDVLADQANRKRTAIAEQAKSENRIMRAYLDGPYTRYQDRRADGKGTLGIIRSNFRGLLDRDITTLCRADIEGWQRKREQEGIAHSTLTRSYGALKTMLRRAIVDEVISDNPLQHVALEKPLDNEKSEKLRIKRNATRRLLTQGELSAFRSGLDAFGEEIRQGRRNSIKHGKDHLTNLDDVAYPHWFIPFAMLCLNTGLRPGDLYTLTWNNELNPTFGRLTKTPNKTRHHPDPARIEMDLPPAAKDLVAAWWTQNGKPDSGLVFPSPVTGRKMDKSAHKKPWTHVKRLGGLPSDLDLYATRHHFISSLVADGVPLLTVATLSGHKTVKMIEEHYHHLCPDASKDILRNYGESLTRQRSLAGADEQGAAV